MRDLLYRVGVWVSAGSFFNIFTSLGIGVATYKGLSFAVDNSLSLLSSQFSSIPVDILQLFALAGGGEAISIVGSAIIVSASISAAKAFVGTRS